MSSFIHVARLCTHKVLSSCKLCGVIQSVNDLFRDCSFVKSHIDRGVMLSHIAIGHTTCVNSHCDLERFLFYASWSLNFF